MNNFCTVADCGRPAQEMLCTGCLTELVTALRELAYGPKDSKGNPTPGLAEELQVTRHRLSISGSTDGRGTGETPLPFHEEASELAWTIANTLGTWVRMFEESNTHLNPWDGDTPAEAAEWLAKYPALLAMHPAADELHDELVWLPTEVRRIVDSAPDRILLGPCGAVYEGVECTDEISGRKDQVVVRCRTCGAEFSGFERWEALKDKVRDTLATATEISGWIAQMYGKVIKVDTVRVWAHRDKVETFEGMGGATLYRVGDVLDMTDRRGGLRRAS